MNLVHLTPFARSSLSCALLALFSAALLPLPAQDTTYTWTAAGGSDWSGETIESSHIYSFSPSTPTSSDNTELVFALSTDYTSDQNLGNLFNLNNLTFGSGGSSYTLTGDSLEFVNNSSGTGPTLTQDSSSAETIGNAFTLGNTLTENGTGSGGIALNGALSGTGGLTISGADTVTLGAANTYTGATLINSGTLALGADSTIADSSSVDLAASGATFDISAGSQTITDLSGVSGATINLGASTLTEGTSNSTTFAGVISDGGNGGSLVKQGAGTLTLTGANTYSGPTVINVGTLTIGAGGSLLNSHVEINGGATLDIAGGSVNAGTAEYFEIGNVASPDVATANLAPGGSITAYEVDIGNVTGATGILNQTGGTNTTTAYLLVGLVSGSTGIYNIDAGTVVNGGLFDLGCDSGSTGTVNLSQTGNISASALVVGVLGTGTFNQNGGNGRHRATIYRWLCRFDGYLQSRRGSCSRRPM